MNEYTKIKPQTFSDPPLRFVGYGVGDCMAYPDYSGLGRRLCTYFISIYFKRVDGVLGLDSVFIGRFVYLLKHRWNIVISRLRTDKENETEKDHLTDSYLSGMDICLVLSGMGTELFATQLLPTHENTLYGLYTGGLPALSA